jgi:hypothetical protein
MCEMSYIPSLAAASIIETKSRSTPHSLPTTSISHGLSVLNTLDLKNLSSDLLKGPTLLYVSYCKVESSFSDSNTRI